VDVEVGGDSIGVEDDERNVDYVPAIVEVSVDGPPRYGWAGEEFA
jgi:hypothetical protein